LDKFKIFETDNYDTCIKSDLSGHREQLRSKLVEYVYPQLREQPYYGKNIKKLVNYKPETWRYRIGEHRLFYTILEEKRLVVMLSVSLRKDAY
jgi:mRNA interferase RelE/StbE